MIRDPSDGSVREPKEINLPANEANGLSPETVSEGIITSGLPPITKNADQLARLEKARDWLKNYLHRKPENNPTTETEESAP